MNLKQTSEADYWVMIDILADIVMSHSQHLNVPNIDEATVNKIESFILVQMEKRAEKEAHHELIVQLLGTDKYKRLA